MLVRLVLFLAICFGASAVVAIRPWRFWRAPRFCPQCKSMMPHRIVWGWDEESDCPRCGCRISQ